MKTGALYFFGKIAIIMGVLLFMAGVGRELGSDAQSNLYFAAGAFWLIGLLMLAFGKKE